MQCLKEVSLGSAVTLQLVMNRWSDENNKEFARVNRFGAYPNYGIDVRFVSLRVFLTLKVIWRYWFWGFLVDWSTRAKNPGFPRPTDEVERGFGGSAGSAPAQPWDWFWLDQPRFASLTSSKVWWSLTSRHYLEVQAIHFSSAIHLQSFTLVASVSIGNQSQVFAYFLTFLSSG